jgi:thioredoxin-related protein
MNKSFTGLLCFSILLALTGLRSAPSASAYKLIVFEGSDWCKKCIRFEKEVLNDPEFRSTLSDWDIELEIIDFPQRKKQSKEEQDYNATIAEKYHFNGVFPTILLSRTDKEDYLDIPYSTFDTRDFLVELEKTRNSLSQ